MENQAKDCMFQFATKLKTYHDTDLLTATECIELFDSCKSDFLNELELGNEPQMAIWVDCASSQSYGRTMRYWDESNIKVIGGRVWTLAE